LFPDNVIAVLNEVTEATTFAGAASNLNSRRDWNERLSIALNGVPPFNQLSGSKLSTFNAMSEFNASTLAGSLIERVLNGIAPAEAFRDLSDLFSRREARFAVIFRIAGIRVQGLISVSADIEVMPPNLVPATRIREEIFDIDKQGMPLYRGSITALRYPTAALIIKDTMTFIYDHEIDWDERKKHADRIDLMKRLALAAMTLASGDCAPFIQVASSWIDHSAYSYSGISGGSGYASFSGVAPVGPCNIDGSELAKLYDRLSRLRGDESAAVTRAVERLCRSRNHVSAVDRAIDLGIAIEMTMLHGIDDRSELKYRTAVNGAWLLGKTPSDRERIFKVLREAYNARSKAVHSGQLPAKKDYGAILAGADRHCADALRAILAVGKFPKWETLIMGE
jgi:hypothetical protein